jgi:hypothetical protein
MTMNDDLSPLSAIDDMLADDDFGAAEETALRAALTDIAALAHEVPEPSAWVTQMIRGELVRAGDNTAASADTTGAARRRILVAATAGVLVLGGASAAAATNHLPQPIQEAVANATESFPVSAPHPRPTNAPTDAPGQVKDKTKDQSNDKDTNSDAPGQIQKATKPDVNDPGPAAPADAGSHGRARAAEVQADHNPGGNSPASPQNVPVPPAPVPTPSATDDDKKGKDEHGKHGKKDKNHH